MHCVTPRETYCVAALQKYDKPKYVLCLAFAASGDVLSGDSNGNIFVWGKGSLIISCCHHVWMYLFVSFFLFFFLFLGCAVSQLKCLA